MFVARVSKHRAERPSVLDRQQVGRGAVLASRHVDEVLDGTGRTIAVAAAYQPTDFCPFDGMAAIEHACHRGALSPGAVGFEDDARGPITRARCCAALLR